MIKDLRAGVVGAAKEMGPYVDAIVLGYGLCGNAMENPDELFTGTPVPVFLPMDEDHPVDDCVGLITSGILWWHRHLACAGGGAGFRAHLDG